MWFDLSGMVSIPDVLFLPLLSAHGLNEIDDADQHPAPPYVIERMPAVVKNAISSRVSDMGPLISHASRMARSTR